MIYATQSAPLTKEDAAIVNAASSSALPMCWFDIQESEHALRRAKIQSREPGALDWRGMVRQDVRNRAG